MFDTISKLEHLKRSLTAEDLFTPKDYEEMCKLDAQTEEGEYRGTVLFDLYVRVVHRPHRQKPGQWVYLINLDQEMENLYNDDMYWRAEYVKFFNGVPTYKEVLGAVTKLLDYRCDRTENKTAVLNVEWDPKKPDFDS